MKTIKDIENEIGLLDYTGNSRRIADILAAIVEQLKEIKLQNPTPPTKQD